MVVLRGDWGGSFEMGWGGSFVKEFVVVVFNSSTNPGGYSMFETRIVISKGVTIKNTRLMY